MISQVHVVSASFEGLSSVKRHQLVYAALSELMSAKVHALNIKAETEIENAA
jgi:BolA protein